MTAETLKPFIPPTSDNFPAVHSVVRRKNKTSNNYLALGFSIAALVFTIALIGVSTWNCLRIADLQKEVQTLTNVIDTLQKHLGINYLEDLQAFEKEYSNALIDDEDGEDDDEDLGDAIDVDSDDDDDKNTGDDDDDDSDEDDDVEYKDYKDLLEKFKGYDDDLGEDEDNDNSSNTSDDDNFYDDFEKFKDSKKKKQTRSTRSIAHDGNEIKLLENDERKPVSSGDHAGHKLNYESLGFKGSQKRHIVAENMDARRSPLRQRTMRRRKIVPMTKSGDSLLSAKSLALLPNVLERPAAHFHLNRKIPERQSAIRIDSYPGDMYIGHPSWSNEVDLDRYFKVEHGVLIVREPGVYYVYAQVCYNNSHDQNGFVIFHGHKPFLQCLNTIPTNLPLKIHTCHTSGLISLKANDSIHLRDFHSDHNAILRDTNNRSYFGLMKI